VTDVEAAPVAAVDGRSARRERNVARVLDVVMEMFADDAMFPTMDQVADRSGLSLRSLYRYFADPSELLQAAIGRHHELTVEAAHLPSIGQGSLPDRISDFAAMRVHLYEQFGSAFRATLANAARHDVVGEILAARRAAMREQFRRQFASELNAMTRRQRVETITVGDALTQLETVHLMSVQGESPRQIDAALRTGLARLLADG